MRYIFAIIIILLIGCSKEHKPAVILSPESKIHYFEPNEFLSLTTHYDSIKAINGFADLNQFYIVATDAGIYFIRKSPHFIEKYFKFSLQSHSKLFSTKDSSIGFLSTDIYQSTVNQKVLFITTNGLVFQVNLKTLSVDWLFKFVGRVWTASYSHGGDLVAIGTDDDFLFDDEHDRYEGRIRKGKPYSTIFLLDSKAGKFVRFLRDYARVKQLSFSNNDRCLFVTYNWPHTEIFRWDLTLDSVTASYSDGTPINDAILSDPSLIVATDYQLLRWSLFLSSDSIVLHPAELFSIETHSLSEGFVAKDFRKLYVFNSNSTIEDTFRVPLGYFEIQQAYDKFQYVFLTLSDTVAYFDIQDRTIKKIIDITYLNSLIR